jgi:rfaE bifunctional protein kinase chain/domain
MRKTNLMRRPTQLRRVEPSLAQIANEFPRRRITVIGDLVADHYIFGRTDRVSREAPVLVVRHENSEVKLGGAGNAAANVRSLGANVTVVGVLGADDMGRELRSLFKLAGIRLQAASGDDVVTETKTRILAGGLNTTRQQMLRVDRGMHAPLSTKIREELSRLVDGAAKDADAILISDYGAGIFTAGLRSQLKKLAGDGLPVCVDSRYSLRAFKGFTLCKPNEPELEALTGIEIRNQSDLLRAGKAAVRELQCQALIATRGRNGMAVFSRSGDHELIPVHGTNEAVDVTGAGDTVIAALTVSLSAGASVGDAARIANVAASIVVQKPGTATVSRDEMNHELDRPA